MVLVAPLDWGLGHATRCIPIIRQFLAADCEVIIAAEGQQRRLLSQEFPTLPLLDLPGYHLRYGKNKRQTLMKIILQVPKILIRINGERKWLAKIYTDKHLDIIIADNRYGLHHPQVVSVFITHQLLIKSSFGRWVDGLLQKINYHFIRRFDYCWVPDAAGDDNLAGELSHPGVMPGVSTRYIGVLSRIRGEPGVGSRESGVHLLVLLSGPEPQRSIFEEKIFAQLNELPCRAVIVRGFAETPAPQGSSLIEVYEHLASEQMEQAIREADIIISRSGYSTVMDVLPLGKKCIFIPTPGQPEQEYLAAYLAARGWCCTASQNDFLLAALVEKARALQLPDLSHLNNPDQLQQSVKKVLSQSPALG